METQKPQRAKVILRKINGTGRSNLPDFRLTAKLQSTRLLWYWQKEKNIDQQNRYRSTK